MKRNLTILMLFLALLNVNAQNVGIGTATPNSTARLDVVDTERGVLVPRLTQAQRDAISSPAQSLLIFNLTSNCYEWWDNYSSSWIQMSCGGCVSAPSAPTANAATSITATSFTANWSASGGATYYRLDVATDMGFTSMVTGYNDLNVGNVTSYNVTGLSCNTTYYYRIRACNACGCSGNSSVVSATTLNSIPSAPVANAASGISTTAFTANWGSVFGATSYRLDVATDIFFTSIVAGYNDLNVGNVTSYNVTGLSCNTTYYYRVRACNSCGCSSNSNSISLTTNACAASVVCDFMGGTNQDSIYTIFAQTGEYYMAGSTNSWGTGNRDGWVFKIDPAFTWSSATARAIGTASYNETILKMIPTSDGGYIATGFIDLGSGNIDIWVLKMNATFTPTWSIRVGGTGAEYGASVTEIASNNYIVVGNTNSTGAGAYDGFIMRLDNTGAIVWQRTYGGTGQDGFNSVITDNAGRVAVAGFATISGNIEALFAIFNIDGTLHLHRGVIGGGIVNAQDIFFDLLQDTDGGYVCAGTTGSIPTNNYTTAGYENAYVVKFDNTGSIAWTRSIGEGATSQRLLSIIKSSDGGFIGAGLHGTMGYATPNFNEAFFCKLTSTGAFSWAKLKGQDPSPGTVADICYDIIETGSGEIVAPILALTSIGYGQTDLWIQQFPSSTGNGGCCQLVNHMGDTNGGSTVNPTFTPATSTLISNTVTLTSTSITFPIQLPFPCALTVKETTNSNNRVKEINQK